MIIEDGNSEERPGENERKYEGNLYCYDCLTAMTTTRTPDGTSSAWISV